PVKGRINYTVWSDVFICPNCSGEIIFWDAAVDKESGKVMDEFNCPHCNAKVNKKNLEKAWVTKYDKAINETIRQVKQVPVLINYSVGRARYEKTPDEFDIKLIEKIEEMDIPYWYPTDRMPEGYNTEQPKKSHGVTHVHHFYTKRNLWVLSAIYNKFKNINQEFLAKLLFTSQLINISKLNRFRFNVSFPYNPLSGTLYISSMISESNVIVAYLNKIDRLTKIKTLGSYTIITSQSSVALSNICSNSIDYIFTDPPFGDNLMYSELNFLWEAWLGVFTDNKSEAIVNNAQHKGLSEYKELMEKCFCEMYRILKPGRWMTVEFHNSKNSVWNSIQEAILKAGFVIAGVKTLDKQQGSFKQVTTTKATKQDLVISAYKPRDSFVRGFLKKAGTEEGAWDYIRQHLEKLPVTVEHKGQLEVIPERQAYLLYDSMLAFHIQKGASIPMGAADFYAGLRQRFPERDGMYFLPDQVILYDKKRMEMELNDQLSFLILDEKTAIQWLRRELEKMPQTYQGIQPKFLQELHQMKHEKLPELMDLLEENFLQDEKGRWYVPDPSKQSDLEKLREKNLLKEFEEYKNSTGRLKVFRTEAIRAGFKKCWRDKDYATIVKIGDRLPESILQEDSSILMYYDNAITRMGEDHV
ncbi:MAG: hypothetical protein PWQ68_2425, partial [Thermoanaerobacteraceae bacterium]|nr:hypothetical protein [Thermoanaerobacteraceae bacterium]